MKCDYFMASVTKSALRRFQEDICGRLGPSIEALQAYSNRVELDH